MVSSTFKMSPCLLPALLMLMASLEETFTNEPSMYNVSADVDVSFTTGGEIPGTTNTTADTGGTPYPEPSTYTTGASPDLSFTTEGENMVTINTTAETGGTSNLDSSMYNVSADVDVSFTAGGEIPGTTNTTADTGGTSYPEPTAYHTSAGPDLSFTTGENMVTINTTTEPGGTSYPDPSTTGAGPDVSCFTTEGENMVSINTTAETGGTSHPEPAAYHTSADPDMSFTTGENMVTINTTTEPGGTSHPGVVSCLLDTDCPPFSSCIPLDGLHLCHCDLGLYFHPDLGCVTARTFPAQIAISALRSTDRASEKRSQPGGPMSREVADLFSDVFGHVGGYLSSSVTGLRPSEGYVTIVHSFSMLHVVTEEALQEELTVSALRCEDGSCISLLGADIYHSLSLCDFAFCDSVSSNCQSQAGLVTCECRDGYYKFNPNDRSCRACDSGFWWTEGHCQRCTLGYGGFNCQEAFLLAVIVETCAVSVLLMSLITVLFYYVRRKKKPKPTFMDSLVLGVSADQPVVKLPRAQFSWTREWEWTDPPGKIPQSLHQEGTVPDHNSEPSDIQMRTFGSVPRPSVTSPYRGSHNVFYQ